MRIVSGNRNTEKMLIAVDDDNDLWYLSNIIEPGDMVRATVFRREEKREDMIRSKESQRKPVTLSIAVDRVEFRNFTDTLKILGIVKEGPEELINVHQSVNVSPGDSIELIGKKWNSGQIELLSEATEQSVKGVLFIALDDESCLVATARNYGINVIARIDSGRSGKMYEVKYSEKDYFKEIQNTISGKEVHTLIILGPGLTRMRLADYLRSSMNSVSILSYAADRTDEAAIYSFLQSDEASKVIESSRLVTEQRLLQQFLKNLSTNGLAAYGYESVKAMAKMSAIDTLLITEDKFHTIEGSSIIKIAEESGSRFFVFSASSEPGIMIQKFGGYCAILRFRAV